MFKHPICFVSLLFILPVIAQATTPIYKWADNNGEVHYDQQPPADRKTSVSVVQAELPHTGDGTTATAPASDQSAPSAPDTVASTPNQQPTQQNASDAKPDNCALAKKRLEALTIHPKVRVIDEKGNAHILDETERQTQITLSNQQITQFCTPQQ